MFIYAQGGLALISAFCYTVLILTMCRTRSKDLIIIKKDYDIHGGGDDVLHDV